MNGRRLIAVAVLAALPALTVSSNEVRVAAGPTDAAWVYALGMSDEEALAMGIAGAITCSFFLAPGAIACGVVGAL